MDLFTQQIFDGEIRFQCQLILDATRDVDAALSRPVDQDAVWRHLQTIVISAGNLSKIFWGYGGKRAESRKPLRDYFKVLDNSPFHDTVLRNHFEHMDERIEDWAETIEPKIFVGRNIGPTSMIKIDGEAPNRRFREYDPSTGVVVFWDRALSIPRLVSEAQRILNVP